VSAPKAKRGCLTPAVGLVVGGSLYPGEGQKLIRGDSDVSWG
jgi:hypothetical protein